MTEEEFKQHQNKTRNKLHNNQFDQWRHVEKTAVKMSILENLEHLLRVSVFRNLSLPTRRYMERQND